MLGHELLHIVAGGAHHATGVEANHVGAPAGIVLVDEDGGVGGQLHHVAVVLHAHHVDGLAEGGVLVAQVAETVGDGILADVDLRPAAVVAVILVERLGKPAGCAVVVLVEQVNGQLGVPLRVVVAPGHHVANDFHLRILGADGLVELVVALVVVVALLSRVGLVVLVAHLQVFQAEGLGMTVLGTHGAILRRRGAVGILDGSEALVDPELDAVVGRHAAMPQTHVDHVEGLGTEVLGQLQIFMIAQSVGGAIAPVHVPVALTLLDGANGALPAEGIVGALLSLHEAASGEAHELRVHLPQHVGQVGAHAVGAVLECRGEEAHHVELEGTNAVEDEGELCLRVVAVALQGGFVLLPALAGGEACHHGFGIELAAVLRAESGLDGALILQAVGPEAEAIGAALHGVDAPVALVDQTDGHLWRGLDDQLKGVVLHAVQQRCLLRGLDEGGGELRRCRSIGRPALHIGGSTEAGAVLEGAVADELGIEATVGCVVNVFVENAVEHGAHLRASVLRIDVDAHLCLRGETATKHGSK